MSERSYGLFWDDAEGRYYLTSGGECVMALGEDTQDAQQIMRAFQNQANYYDLRDAAEQVVAAVEALK